MLFGMYVMWKFVPEALNIFQSSYYISGSPKKCFAHLDVCYKEHAR